MDITKKIINNYGILFISRYNLAVDNLKTAVKFLMGTLPAVMGPEIVFRLTLDGLLKHLEEAARYLMLRQIVGVIGDEMVCAGVIAALGPARLKVKDGVIEFFHQTLSTGEYGRVMVEERYPQVYVLPFWRLVGD